MPSLKQCILKHGRPLSKVEVRNLLGLVKAAEKKGASPEAAGASVLEDLIGQLEKDRQSVLGEMQKGAASLAKVGRETEQLQMFKEKKKAERRVPQWVTTSTEEIVDEETGEKVKAGLLTPEAEEALRKAGVRTGPGPFPAGSNYIVSITEDKGGLIYGLAKASDERTTKTKDLLQGKETITEYWRKIAGKEFKVLNTPILPKKKQDRVKLIDKLVNEFKKETEWYSNWNDYMTRFEGKQYTQPQKDKMLMIQAVLSAGASPQGAQTAFGKVMNGLEEFGSIEGGEGKGTTKNIAAKVNRIWEEDLTHLNLAEYQDMYGKKIGAMVFAGLHPKTKEGAVVVDRHIARLWGHNVMWGNVFRVPKHLQAEVTEDIVDAAQRWDMPVPAVQAALWYATGAGHWGSATHFDESIQIAPKKSLSYNMVSLISLEPQAIVSFHGQLYFTVRGARPPKKLTNKELQRLGDLQEKSRTFSTLGTSGLTGEEADELLELQHKKEGVAPNPWSKGDVQARMDAATPDNDYVSLSYWYGPGVRRESYFWSAEPHLIMVYENEIYDADKDVLGYRELAWQRAQNDSLVKKGQRTASQVYTNALAGLIKRSGDFKGYSLSENGNTWVFTFDQTEVEEHPKIVTVALSDRVSGIVKLPDNLYDLAEASAEPAKKLLDHVEKELKNYPISIQSYSATLARLESSTSGEPEYGLSMTVKGPITAIRAAFSHIIGAQKKQNIVLLMSESGAPDGNLFRFRFADDDLKKIDKALRKNHIQDFNIKRAKAAWWFETFIPQELAESREFVDNLVNFYKHVGVDGTLENTPVASEALTREPIPEALTSTDYQHHILKYFGKKKGADVYARAIQQGDEWAANAYLVSSTEAARAGKQGDAAGKGRGVLDSFSEPEREKPGAEPKLEEAPLLGGVVGAFGDKGKQTQLGVARDLLSEKGASPGDVWKQTGWYLGADSYWRFEIDDAKMHVLDPKSTSSAVWRINNRPVGWRKAATVKMDGPIRRSLSPVKLGDILNHPDLYRIYPQLKEVSVEVFPGVGGFYDPNENLIGVGSAQFNKDASFVETIIHETQHAIQNIEGFSGGSSPEVEFNWLMAHDPKFAGYSEEKQWDLANNRYWRVLGEIEAADVEDRLTWMTSAEKKNVPPFTGVRATMIPRRDWVITKGGMSMSFAIHDAINTSSGRSMLEFLRGYRRGNQVASYLREALEESGLAQFPDVMKRIDVVLKPWLTLDPQTVRPDSWESYAKQFNASIAEVQRRVVEGAIGVRGLTSWRNPLHAVISLSLGMNKTPESFKEVTYHELWHVVEQWLLPDAIYDKFTKAYPDSEARADKFAEYLGNRQKQPPPSWLEEIFARLIYFFKYMRAKLLGMNVVHANDVYEWMRRGYFAPTVALRKTDAYGNAASPGLLADLKDMESDPAHVNTLAKPKDLEFDDETTGRKRVRDLVRGWMQPPDGMFTGVAEEITPEEKRRRALDKADEILKGILKAEPSLAETGWTPEKGQADAQGADNTIPKIIEMPEMLELYKALMGGRLPGVRERLFGRDTIRGVFIPGKGVVRLRADIFKNPDLAARVLAHEIGHIIDWLPDNILAGTILGKIASIRDWAKNTLPFKPGDLGELTEADVARLRAEAIQLLGMTQVLRTKWIDTTLTEELKISPEDVLNIWNAVEKAKLLSPELYKYVAGLDTNAKKTIVKAALKGQLTQDIMDFVKSVRVGAKTRKQVTEVEYVPPSQEAIAKKLAELLEKEIRTRKLWVENEIRDELKTLSARWRPFDPAMSSKSYVKYRWSSEELYADAISALFNDPQFLRAQAPKFYEAFFNYLENKREVRDVYMDIQRILHSGEVDKNRTENFYRMFDRGNELMGKAFEDIGLGLPDSFKRAFWDTYHMILKDVRKVGEGNIPVDDNPRYKLEEMTYTGSEVEAFMTDIYTNVVKPLEKVNLKWDRQFGLVVLLRRVIHERDKMANPAGTDIQKAMDKLEAMRTSELTETQWTTLMEAVKAFREIHEKYFIDKAEAAQVYSDDMIKLFRDNTAYATFDVLSYLEERYGRASANLLYKIPKQIGTVMDVGNPATSTVMRDIAFIKSVNKNIAVRATVKFYQDYASILGIDVKEADRKWNGKFRAIQKPKDPTLGLVVYLYKGKAYGYYLPKGIADAVNENHTLYTMTARIFRWLAQPFRKIFTELNYGFWIFNAFFRDAQRMFMALPGYRVDQFAKHWVKGLKPAFRSVFGISDETIQEMQRGNMLVSVGDYHGLNEEDEQLERLMRMYHFKPHQVYKKHFLTPFGHLFNYISNRARLAEWYFSGVGRALERTTKVGTYTYLTEKFPDMPLEVIGHIVRTRGGSPDFLRAGREQQLYNNILLFSNAMKEGYRGDVEAFKENPGEFLIKKAALVFLPKLLMWGGLIGLLGPAIKEIFDGVSEYDLTNYVIIPLGRTESGKSVYWRVPLDETSRFLTGIFWKILRAPELGIANQGTALFDYMAGQAPTMSPGISIVTDVLEYASGLNPYDHFYGRHAIGELEFAAGGWRAHRQFLQHLATKMGASVVYKFKHDKVEKIAEELESVLGFPISSKVADFVVELPDEPVVSNILGRFLKVSDYGTREAILREKKKIKQENARGILDAREAAYAIVDGEMPNADQMLALAQKPDVVTRQMMLALARKYGMVYFEEWVSAGTNAEKFAVLKLMMEKNALNYQDVTGLASPPPVEKPNPAEPGSPYPPLSLQELLERETSQR